MFNITNEFRKCTSTYVVLKVLPKLAPTPTRLDLGVMVGIQKDYGRSGGLLLIDEAETGPDQRTLNSGKTFL